MYFAVGTQWKYGQGVFVLHVEQKSFVVMLYCQLALYLQIDAGDVLLEVNRDPVSDFTTKEGKKPNPELRTIL